MGSITVVPYDPAWPRQFEALNAVLMGALGSVALAIEHVGSTSVPGLAAKPVLDIDIVVADDAALRRATPLLEALGYEHRGELGIPGRHAFRHILKPGAETSAPAHHLYCCIAGSLSLRNHLLFREALRADAGLAQEYGALKMSLARTVPDIGTYVESKTAFITGVLQRSGIDAEQLQEITDQNRKA